MRVLFYVFPQVLPQGPHFNTGWSMLLAQIMRGLAAADRDHCHMVTGRRFEPALAAMNDNLAVSYVDELELLRRVREADPAAALPTELSRQSRAKDAAERPAIKALLSMLGELVGEFEPDVVITFSMRADYLKALWPQAHILHVESGAFSRFPYPYTLIFDHLGMYSEAGPSLLDPATLEVSEESLQLAADLRDHALQRFERTDPFYGYDFRTRFERLALFPLQVSNYYSFDEQSPHRTQFEYLVDVLAQAPRELGVIVTEYIQWGEVLQSEGGSMNLDWLRRSFPNLIFHDSFRKFYSPSQYLLGHVDGAYTVASNLGYQALLSGKRLGCGPSSYLQNVAHDRDPASFFRNVAANAPAQDRLAFLAWYLERYLVPESLYTDGTWFSAYLESRVQLIRGGCQPAEAFPRVADVPALRGLWLGGEESPRPAPYQTPANRRIHALAQAELATAAATQPKEFATLGRPEGTGTRDAYLLLNDTRWLDDGLHLGRNASTAFIEGWMAHAGLTCLGRASVAQECEVLLASPELDRVKFAILNGEDSVYHDSARMLELITFCRELKARGIPSVLINSGWHENSAGLGELLDTFEIVSVREPRSLAAIKPWRPDALMVPDLSFAAFQVPGLLPADSAPPPAHSAWTVIDHEEAGVAKVLHGFAEAHGFPFHLMGKLNVDALIREPEQTFEAAGCPNPRVLRSIGALKTADACLTGRFHGLTAALCARMPVVALPSNTPKVEGLLFDIGIARQVILDKDWLGLGHNRQLDLINERFASQGKSVHGAVDRYLTRAMRDISALMREVTRVGDG